jgi:hypothetical protein
MKKAISVSSLLLLVALFVGCATTESPQQDVLISESTSVGKRIRLDDENAVADLLKAKPQFVGAIQVARAKLKASGLTVQNTGYCNFYKALYRSWPLGRPYARMSVSCNQIFEEAHTAPEIWNYTTFESNYGSGYYYFRTSGSADAPSIPYRSGNYYCAEGNGYAILYGWFYWDYAPPACGTL